MEEKKHTEEDHRLCNQGDSDTFEIKISTKDAAGLEKIRDHIAKYFYWNPRGHMN